MKQLNFLLPVFSAFYINAQVISGTVIFKEENKPIPYVKIGVEKENNGIISDEKGNFSIDLSNSNTSHKVKVGVTEGIQN
ncbi:carboxypeptidase-like regulatory domain-containing protein [Chryseobacterium sp. FH2]|uniref:carboxypeptidase-like regulatory domain-containing protein n=1 Tax=Chryseobacterium sp. FH2 TaxID=1674291 RepID=UPI00065A985D|nr:carboxypeptidase-like regulatory domain-containing protein [Chryseobacterium sp. FH2]